MKAIKQNETTYTSLHHCLEAHFGTRCRTSETAHREYREAEQGPRTVLFQSRYPLQLDYMTRRKAGARRSHRLTQIISRFKNN